MYKTKITTPFGEDYVYEYKNKQSEIIQKSDEYSLEPGDYTFSIFINQNREIKINNYLELEINNELYSISDEENIVKYEDGWYRIYQFYTQTSQEVVRLQIRSQQEDDNIFLFGLQINKGRILKPYSTNKDKVKGHQTNNFTNIEHEGNFSLWKYQDKENTMNKLKLYSFGNENTQINQKEKPNMYFELEEEQMYFNGTDSYIDTEYGEQKDPSQTHLTLNQWVKSNDPNQSKMFLQTQDHGTQERAYFGTYQGKWSMGIQSSGWGNGKIDQDTEWHLLTIVFDGQKQKMYVDSSFSHEKEYTSYSLLTNFMIGKGNGYYWNGNIKDVQIYNHQLSDFEIRNLYEKGINKYDSRLVQYYPLNEQSNENIQNDNKINKSFKFNGSEYIESNNSNNFKEIAVEQWFKTTNTNPYNMFFNIDNQTYGNPQLRTSSGYVQFRFYGQSTCQSPEQYNDGQWHYQVGTYKNKEYKLYVDGELVKTEQANYDIVQNGTIHLGLYTYQGQNFYDGNLKNIRVWKRQLSESEIKYYMNNEPNHKDANLIGYWKLEDDQKDYSSYGNHGINYGQIPEEEQKYNGSIYNIKNKNKSTEIIKESDYNLKSGLNMMSMNKYDDSQMYFNGIDNYISLNYDDKFNFQNSFSIQFWLNPKENQNKVIIGKHGSYGFVLMNDNSIKFVVWFDDWVTNTIAKVNEWHYYCIVYDKNKKNRYLYVDGIKKEERYGSLNIPANSSPITIGKWFSATNEQFYNGYIKEVSIFQKNLSSQEIRYYMNNPPSGKEPKLLLYQPLKNGDISDKSPYNHQQTNYGQTPVQLNKYKSNIYNIDSKEIDFDGNTYLYKPITLGQDQTISCWQKSNVGQTEDRMIWSLSTDQYAGPDLYFSKSYICLNTGDSQNNKFLDKNNNPINYTDDMIWKKYDVVFDSVKNKQLLYINGKYTGQQTYKNPSQTNKNFYISRFESGNYEFSGGIKNIQVWNYQKSKKEIEYDYVNNFKPVMNRKTDDSLVLKYDFEEYQEPTENILRNKLIKTDTKKFQYDGWSIIGIGKDTRKYIQNSPIPVAPNTKYTFSCIAFSSELNLGELDIYIKLDGTGYPEGNIYIQLTDSQHFEKYEKNDLGNGFYKLIGTFTTTTDTSNILQVFFDSDLANVETFVQNLKIEAKDHQTPFTYNKRKGFQLDKSTNNNHQELSLTNTPTYNEIEKQYEFNGANKIETNKLFNDDLEQEWTVQQWVYLNDQSIYNQQLNNFNRGNEIIHNGSNKKQLLYINYGDNDSYTYSNNQMVENQWFHIQFILNTKQLRSEIFINGVLNQQSSNFTQNDIPQGFPETTVFGENLRGKLKDVRIYSKQLSDLEVKELYESTKNLTKQEGLVLYSSLTDNDIRDYVSGEILRTDYELNWVKNQFDKSQVNLIDEITFYTNRLNNINNIILGNQNENESINGKYIYLKQKKNADNNNRLIERQRVEGYKFYLSGVDDK